MIIECPSCATRYDIKATLPPEGRSVRCAKCSTVWRATGALASTEAAPTEPSTNSEEPAAQANASNGIAIPTVEESRPYEEGHTSEWDDAARKEHDAFNQEALRAESRDEANLAFGTTAGAPRSDPLPRAERDFGKVRWFSNFRRKPKSRTEEVPERDAGTPISAAPEASSIPFPRPVLSGDREPPSLAIDSHSLEEAREAVRSVFSSLGEVRPQSNGRAFYSPVSPQETDAVKELGPGKEGAGEQEGGASEASAGRQGAWKGLDDEPERRFPEGLARAWLERPSFAKTEGEEVPGEEDSPDAALRKAMRAPFPSIASEDLAKNMEAHLRAVRDAENDASGMWQERSASLWQRQTTEVDPVGEQAVVTEDDADNKGDETAFDPRLFREIEETQSQAGEAHRRQQRGGLALAAAWGLFLCIASGLLVGLFAFRDTAADALPGLVPVYRALGVPVTVQPLIFESVQYEWSLSENKPSLIVSGSVYNRASRSVAVPQFFITVKDEDPALDREYSARLKVEGSKINSNERAEFEIELLAPNRTVTSIELELREGR